MEQNDQTLPCDQKMVFDTKKAAQTAATVAKYQHGRVLKAYKCKHCGLWHLASS